MIPKLMFLTRGVGVDKNKLSSFELALRDAGIERYNLVYVSSILPPNCKIIPRKEGLLHLKPGQIVYCVMARNDTEEPNRLISASIGVARPKDQDQYGYLSEHHSYGQTAEVSGNYAEDLAATMLASTLGIPFDPNQAWDDRKEVYQASGTFFKASHVCQSAEGNKNGLWTTVVACAVFILE
ncbi:MAG: arginine decarboxylase, pyruvoyl-dependent [Candidatus Zixiibacteriota bacterium]